MESMAFVSVRTLAICFWIFIVVIAAEEPACKPGDATCHSSNAKPTYLIGSGWHASASGFHPLPKINTRVDAIVRTPAWFPVWYKHLMHFTSPVQVVVAASGEGIIPEHIGTPEQSKLYPKLEWIPLTRNFGP